MKVHWRTVLACLAVLLCCTAVGSYALASGDEWPTNLPHKCTGHALPAPLGKPQQVFENTTVLPLTFNISEHCPLLPKTDVVCCQELQYSFMAVMLGIMDHTFQDCEACNAAIRNMWCHYTCSPYQGYYDNPVSVNHTTHQILGTELIVSQSFAKRVWQSCDNSIFSQFEVKVMFPSVAGLFTAMADFSPAVSGEAGGHIVERVVVAGEGNHGKNLPKGLVPLNASTVQQDYACSRGQIVATKPHYPMPRATVGGLSSQVATAIFLGALLFALTIVGILNGSHDRLFEKDADYQLANGRSTTVEEGEDDVGEIVEENEHASLVKGNGKATAMMKKQREDEEEDKEEKDTTSDGSAKQMLPVQNHDED